MPLSQNLGPFIEESKQLVACLTKCYAAFAGQVQLMQQSLPSGEGVGSLSPYQETVCTQSSLKKDFDEEIKLQQQKMDSLGEKPEGHVLTSTEEGDHLDFLQSILKLRRNVLESISDFQQLWEQLKMLRREQFISVKSIAMPDLGLIQVSDKSQHGPFDLPNLFDDKYYGLLLDYREKYKQVSQHYADLGSKTVANAAKQEASQGSSSSIESNQVFIVGQNARITKLIGRMKSSLLCLDPKFAENLSFLMAQLTSVQKIIERQIQAITGVDNSQHCLPDHPPTSSIIVKEPHHALVASFKSVIATRPRRAQFVGKKKVKESRKKPPHNWQDSGVKDKVPPLEDIDELMARMGLGPEVKQQLPGQKKKKKKKKKKITLSECNRAFVNLNQLSKAALLIKRGLQWLNNNTHQREALLMRQNQMRKNYSDCRILFDCTNSREVIRIRHELQH